MLTENEVSKSWHLLFCKGVTVDKTTFAKAEDLLEELRAESPLRHRLSVELGELKQMHAPKPKARRKQKLAAT